jgi:hypothetical protein
MLLLKNLKGPDQTSGGYTSQGYQMLSQCSTPPALSCTLAQFSNIFFLTLQPGCHGPPLENKKTIGIIPSGQKQNTDVT